MSEILGAMLLGLIVQGIIFKVLAAKGFSTLIALAISTIAYAVPYIAINTYRLAEDGDKGLSQVAAVGIPAALIASAIIYAIVWSQSKPAAE